MAKFDWYQATIHQAKTEEIAHALQAHFELSDIAPCTPRNGYTHGAKIQTGQDVHAEIWYGGNLGTHVKATGQKSPPVSKVVRAWEHRVTRADACEDWIEAGLFDRISRQLLSYAVPRKIKINQQGDWERSQGRTLYLGSRQSSCQLVLYEKGYEIGLENGGDPNHVRLEVRVYPKGDSGYLLSNKQPGELFSSTRWLVEAMERIGWDHLSPLGIGTVWRPKDSQRARNALLRQYGKTLTDWAEEAGGWDSIGKAIQNGLADIQSGSFGRERTAEHATERTVMNTERAEDVA